MHINESHSIARFMPVRSARQMNALQQHRTADQSPKTGEPRAAGMARTLLAAKRTLAAAPPAANLPAAAQSLPTGTQTIQMPPPAPPSPPAGKQTIQKAPPPAPPSLPTGKHTIQKPPHLNPLEALIADWGKSDSPYDLDGDGTVGILDMLQLLAEWTLKPNDPPPADPDPGVTPPPKTPGDVVNPDPPPSNPLQDLIDAWGQTNSPHDLNGDGTVGILDLLELLKRMSEESDKPDGIAIDAADTPPSAIDPGAAGTPPAKTPLELLIEDWGQSGSPFDLNQDGTVGIRDMLMLLAQMTNSPPPPAIPAISHEPENDREVGRGRSISATYHRVAAQNIARALAPQMSTMQPGELRESIQGSNLPDVQKRFVLDQIAALHPHGHHVSLVG